MLAAGRQSNQRIGQSELRALFRRDRGVGHARGMTDECLHAAQALAEREEAARRDERRRLPRPCLRARTTPCRRTRSSAASRSRGPDGPADPGKYTRLNERMILQRRGNRGGVVGVPLHPQLQRLQSAQRQPAVERRRHRPGRVLQELDRLEHGGVACASTAPWITSEWPARYFVTLWTTRSAPSSNGCWKSGEANVLSTTSSAPAACVAPRRWRRCHTRADADWSATRSIPVSFSASRPLRAHPVGRDRSGGRRSRSAGTLCSGCDRCRRRRRAG